MDCGAEFFVEVLARWPTFRKNLESYKIRNHRRSPCIRRFARAADWVRFLETIETPPFVKKIRLAKCQKRIIALLADMSRILRIVFDKNKGKSRQINQTSKTDADDAENETSFAKT